MARRRMGEGASPATAAFLAGPEGERIAGAKRAKPKTELEKVTSDAQLRARSGDWDGATAQTFIGLYALCHTLSYGVAPAELVGAGEFRAASRASLSILHGHFADDPYAFATFIRWCWQKEQRKLEWLRSQGKEGSRMGWRLQFSAQKVTDYRVASVEAEKRKR